VTGLTSSTVLEALRNHYRKPGTDRDGEILIPEVQAPGSQRRADLVRIGMWASRGVGVDVHEIKVSRPDWLRELNDPAKAEAWWPYCNRFWVVAVPGIVTDGELPAGWGLLELPRSGRRFRTVVRADTRQDVQLTVPLLVEMIRRADNARLAQIDRIREEHRDNIRKRDAEWRQLKADGELPPATRDRLNLMDKLEQALGMPLVKYPWPRLPVQDVSPQELGAFLTDVREHVTAQRRTAAAADQAALVRGAAVRALKELDEIDRLPRQA
jgi:hypothetical protein